MRLHTDEQLRTARRALKIYGSWDAMRKLGTRGDDGVLYLRPWLDLPNGRSAEQATRSTEEREADLAALR